MNKTNYNIFEITYLTDNIKFADSKASVLIGINGLLLSWAIDYYKASGMTFNAPLNIALLAGHFFVIAGLAFLIIGLILSVAVVFPRRGSAAQKGFVFWESIAKYPSAADYSHAVMTIAEDELDRRVAEQQYFVSITATRKYNMLRRAFWATSVAALFVILTAITMK